MAGRDDTNQHQPARLPDPEVTPTLSLVEAGRFLGIGRSATYELARTGRFPVDVLDVGRLKAVPTAALRRYLHVDVDPSQ